MIIHSIPPLSDALTPSVGVKARFNLATGNYEFDSAELYDLLQLNSGSAYLMENIAVRGVISNNDFMRSSIIGPMTIRFSTSMSIGRSQHFKDLYQVNNIDQAQPKNTVFYSSAGDIFQISVSGKFNQLPSMIDIEDLDFRVSADIYRIQSGEFVDQIKREMGQ